MAKQTKATLTITATDPNGKPTVQITVGDSGSARAVAAKYRAEGRTVEITKNER